MNTDANIDSDLIEEQTTEKGNSPTVNNRTKILLITLFIIVIIVIFIVCVLVIRNMRKVSAPEEKKSSIKEDNKPIKEKSHDTEQEIINENKIPTLPSRRDSDDLTQKLEILSCQKDSSTDKEYAQLGLVYEEEITKKQYYNILKALKNINKNFTEINTGELKKYIPIISNKFHLINSLNNNIKNYSTLLNINIIDTIPIKKYKVSLTFNKGISSCIRSSQVQDIDSFIINMCSIFPVDNKLIESFSQTVIDNIK